MKLRSGKNMNISLDEHTNFNRKRSSSSLTSPSTSTTQINPTLYTISTRSQTKKRRLLPSSSLLLSTSKYKNDQLSNNKSLSLISLPTEVIDRIIFYYLPFCSFQTTRFKQDCLANSVMPLALTCKFMFDRISKAIVPHIEDNNLFSKIVLISSSPTTNSPQNHLLFKAAGIALNHLLKQNTSNLDLIKVNSSTCVRTRSMTSSNMNHQQPQIDLIVSQNKKQISSQYYCWSTHLKPLFDINGHTEECRVVMAWIIFAATSGKLSKLSFASLNKRTRQNNQFESCILRLCTILNLPLETLYLTHNSYQHSLQSKQISQDLILSISKSLVDLRIDLASTIFVQAICNTRLPNLKTIFLRDLTFNFLHQPSRSTILRKRLIRILKSLKQNGTTLSNLYVEDPWFLVRSKNDQVIDLNRLAPTVKHLEIKWVRNYFTTSEDFNNSFKFCHNLETLELKFETGWFVYQDLEDVCRSGIIPALKNICLRQIRRVKLPLNLNDKSNSYLENSNSLCSAPMVKSFNLRQTIDSEELDLLRNNFSSLERLSVVIEPDTISSLCQLVRETKNLDQLSISIKTRRDRNCSETLYSSEMVRTIFQASSSLDTLYVHGFCVTVEQGISFLQRMGSKVTRFRVPLVEQCNEKDGYITVTPISPEQVIRILDVIMNFCPNMERLSITLHCSRVQWSDEQKLLVENAVKQVALRLRNFDFWLFIEALENEVASRRYCD